MNAIASASVVMATLLESMTGGSNQNSGISVERLAEGMVPR
jgi:hypothetical protein